VCGRRARDGEQPVPGKYDELARRFRAVYIVPLTKRAAEALRRTALPKGVYVVPLRELGKRLKKDDPRAHVCPTDRPKSSPSGFEPRTF